MRQILFFLVVQSILFGCATHYARKPEDLKAILARGKPLTLYSLEPWTDQDNYRNKFYDTENLGSVELVSSDATVVVKEFSAAIVEDRDFAIGCHSPRHALRVLYSGDIYDFLLCFECMNISIHKNGELYSQNDAGGSPDVLNAILASHNIRLSKSGRR
jgi:hypothetical protein